MPPRCCAPPVPIDSHCNERQPLAIACLGLAQASAQGDANPKELLAEKPTAVGCNTRIAICCHSEAPP